MITATNWPGRASLSRNDPPLRDRAPPSSAAARCVTARSLRDSRARRFSVIDAFGQQEALEPRERADPLANAAALPSAATDFAAEQSSCPAVD